MSFAALNRPPLVAATGAATLFLLPTLETFLASPTPLVIVKAANVSGFLTNVVAVSIPGRIDGLQDEAMRRGNLDPPAPRTRSLLLPSGWAFIVWAPIYLGEMIFVAASSLASDGCALAGMLPRVSAPFIVANIMQSLWCASFRPSYNNGWRKYISFSMLGGTAWCLSKLHAIERNESLSTEGASLSWYLLPMTVHFGWTTAATLVNLNASLAMEETISDRSVIGVGHASVIVATLLGMGITLVRSAPAYGATVAWALAACATGMTKHLKESHTTTSETWIAGAKVQRMLCWTGVWGCLGSVVGSSLF